MSTQNMSTAELSKDYLHFFQDACAGSSDVLDALHTLVSLKDTGVPVEHYDAIARACVTYLIRVCSVKKFDLYSTFLESPESVNPESFGLQEMVKAWVENVGDMKDTMHWSSPDVMLLVQAMNVLELSGLRSAFCHWDCVRTRMNGIADVLFVASCFRVPFVVRLGELFWAFAREILLVKIDTSDDLNLFLYGTIMPQTVIVLGPTTYALDSDMPSICGNISIRGSDQGVDNLTYSKTTIRCFEQGLCFSSGISIQNVCFIHATPAPLNCAIRIRGVDKMATKVRIQGVKISNGGIRFSNCREVNMYETSIENALVGVYANDVDMLSVNPRHDSQLGFVFSEKASFKLCQTAFYIFKAKYFCSCFQVYHQCTRMYHACIETKMAVIDCDFMECGKIGRVMGPTGAQLLMARCYFDMKNGTLDAGAKCTVGRVAYESIHPSLFRNINHQISESLKPEEA